MPASFVLTLDTTAPGGVTLSLNGGAAYATVRDVTAAIACSDADTTGYQVKLWGDVDAAANASIQPTEGGSAWISWTTAQAVRLSAGDGAKTLNLKVRDDVGNESAAASDSITLDTTLPVVSITVPADRVKLSKVAGFDTTHFTFSVDSDAQGWKVKCVPDAGATEDQGTVIPTTAGSTNTTGGALAAGTPVQVTIKGADLEAASAGDGAKTVKIYACDVGGSWSV